jgi:hypothetical protein
LIDWQFNQGNPGVAARTWASQLGPTPGGNIYFAGPGVSRKKPNFKTPVFEPVAGAGRVNRMNPAKKYISGFQKQRRVLILEMY